MALCPYCERGDHWAARHDYEPDCGCQEPRCIGRPTDDDLDREGRGDVGMYDDSPEVVDHRDELDSRDRLLPWRSVSA